MNKQRNRKRGLLVCSLAGWFASMLIVAAPVLANQAPGTGPSDAKQGVFKNPHLSIVSILAEYGPGEKSDMGTGVVIARAQTGHLEIRVGYG